MIQFNLLPDIKLEYIKAQKTKHAVQFIAFIVTAAALGVLVLLFTSVQLQNRHISNLTEDIDTTSEQLEGIEDLDRILTVQSQLNKLGELHADKPVVSRLKGYIDQFTPAEVSYSEIVIDFKNSTMSLTGSTDSIRSANRFVDTLKFTKYQIVPNEGEEQAPVVDEVEQLAFKNVVLSSFGKDDKGTSYTIELEFDPVIFSSDSAIKLVIEEGFITTRSAIEKPENIIQELRNSETEVTP